MNKKIFLLSFLLFLPTMAQAATVSLSVPFTSEIPNGKWVKPWNNACEEASIVMVEQYYLGYKKRKMPKAEAINLMTPIFPWEDKQFGGSADTDSTQTAKIINSFSSMTAEIVQNPTLEAIKAELDAGRPVLSMHYGFDLKNPNIPFRRNGSSYHVMALIGYDDTKDEFIANDPGNDHSGLDYRYKYDTIMSTLHDFNHKNGKADGVPVVLFTNLKTFVKTKDSPAVYLVRGNIKYAIPSSEVFKRYHWSWKAVKVISGEELVKYEDGRPIK